MSFAALRCAYYITTSVPNLPVLCKTSFLTVFILKWSNMKYVLRSVDFSSGHVLIAIANKTDRKKRASSK